MKKEITSLPKSLWKFYTQYGIKNYRFLLICWMVAVLVMFSGGVIWPNFERWVVALFETPVPVGVTFVKYAIPTILLITILNMAMTASDLIRDTISSHMWPRVMNQISETLTTYTHKQSMTFWTSKMSGSINTQINYITEGLTGGLSELWYCIGRFGVILINGVFIVFQNNLCVFYA